MISVCMATKNGGRYIGEQINSILPQLSENDELIISDDCSSDNTASIVKSYVDSRIKFIGNALPVGVLKNFERSLRHSRGKYIFLADQDDVWFPEKIQEMLPHLKNNDLVISDCVIVDEKLVPKFQSYFEINQSRSGLVKNLIKNSYMGCCMAFTREVLERSLPFPSNISFHDFWIGLVAERHFKVQFVNKPLMYHRRHLHNASATAQKSPLSLKRKMVDRYHLIMNLIRR